MKPHSSLKRWLALGTTVAVFGVVGTVLVWRPTFTPQAADAAPPAAPAKEDAKATWPIFGGTPQRNMVNTVDKNIPTEWEAVWKDTPQGKVLDVEKSKNVKWAAQLGTCSYGGPVVAGGKIFLGTNNGSPRHPSITGDKGVLMCFSEKDGSFLWEAIHNKLESGQVNDYPKQGVCSAPVVEGDRLYYVNNRCELVCADVNGNPETKEAKYLWKLDMMKGLNVFPHNLAVCSPVIVGDLIFVVTANGVDEDHYNIPSPLAPSFIAVKKKDGTLVWKDSSPGKQIMHGQWSNPVYSPTPGKGQIIFPGGDGWLYAFEPETGTLIWKFDANPKDSKYVLGGRGTRSDFIGTPVVVGDRLFIGTGQDPEHYEGTGHLWCVDITKKGDISPELSQDGKVPSVKFAPNPNSGVVWHYGGDVPKDKRGQIGRDYYFGRTMSTVAVQDGLLYVGELAGYLHCLDAKTGQHYWAYDLKAALWGSPYWVDGKVYICTDDGDVWIFKHSKDAVNPGKGLPQPKEKPKKIEMEEQNFKGTPIVANGTLYLMSETYLFAVANKK